MICFENLFVFQNQFKNEAALKIVPDLILPSPALHALFPGNMFPNNTTPNVPKNMPKNMPKNSPFCSFALFLMVVIKKKVIKKIIFFSINQNLLEI